MILYYDLFEKLYQIYFCAIKCLAKYPSRYGERFQYKEAMEIGTFFLISPSTIRNTVN